MELRQLQYFVRVAETLSFSEAARGCFVTQSTLSQQIKQLEDELGTKLFDRNSHEVLLTEAGLHLLPLAKRTLADADLCTEEMKDLEEMLTGRLNIGVTYSFSSLLSGSLMDFMKRYPGVTLNVSYRPMAELMRMLRTREVDFVLGFQPLKAMPNIESHVLFDTRLSAIVGENHPLAKRESVSLSELSHYNLALPAQGMQARSMLDHLLKIHSEELRWRLEINDVHLLFAILRENNYVSLLAKTTIHNEEGLVGVPLEDEGPSMIGCIHTLKDSYMKKSMVEFCRLLSESNAIRQYSSLTDMK